MAVEDLSCSSDTASISSSISSQMSSVYDLIDRENILDGIDPGQVLLKQKPKIPNPMPYVAFKDFNNLGDDMYNRPKPAVEIGLRFEF